MADHPSPSTTTEPLAILARFAYDFAPHLCDPAPKCRDYHRAWSLLRHYESDGALPLGIDFFRRELGVLADDLGRAHLRIMITGAADTGIAAMVLQALAPLKIQPEFVIVDLCRTTLLQQRMFLTMAGVPTEFIQGDAVTVQAEPVDALVAHSFIGHVAPDRRGTLFANWARQLRPMGRIMLTERLAPASGMLPAWPDPAEREARRAALAKRLGDEDLSEQDRDGFLEVADRLWDLTGKRHRMGLEDFRATASAAGLGIRTLDEIVSLENVSPVHAKASSAIRPRHEIVLERR